MRCFLLVAMIFLHFFVIQLYFGKMIVISVNIYNLPLLNGYVFSPRPFCFSIGFHARSLLISQLVIFAKIFLETNSYFWIDLHVLSSSFCKSVSKKIRIQFQVLYPRGVACDKNLHICVFIRKIQDFLLTPPNGKLSPIKDDP